MDRRNFIRGAGVVGGLSMLSGGEVLSKTLPPGGDSASRSAMLKLLQTLGEVEQTYISPEFRITRPEDVAEAERLLAHLLETGLHFWLEADPERPVFKQYVTPTRKLLGDNPDSIYYFAPIRDDREYRIRGNIGSATFTSFTIEGGSGEGQAATRSISELDDRNLKVDADGNFEIIVSRNKPRRGNWLKLEKGAGQVTTRHYHESRVSVVANPEVTIDLEIEPVDPAPLQPWGGDSHIAEKLTHVANFVRAHMAMSMGNPEMSAKIGWVSTTPNTFNKPGQWKSESGYGNLSAWYASAPYVLRPGEALEITGRFPDCRFANVVLWNRFMQSHDFTKRRISLNRKQIQYEDDGSFRIVVAHKDPGTPNWLATEGRMSGVMYWRYVYPVTPPETPQARVIKL